jgi:hypothetical protein
MRFAAEVDIFQQQVGCEQQIVDGAARAEDRAIVADSQLQSGPGRQPNLSYDTV